jgi:ADP-heptose:LPS heptosyltransferase
MLATSSQKKILVYQIGSIGDTVVTIPSLLAVRRHFGKRASIILLHESRPGLPTTPQSVLPDGIVDEFIEYAFAPSMVKKITVVGSLLRKIRNLKFDAVVYMAPCERSSKQVKRDKLFFQLCGIPDKIGFHVFPPWELYPRDPDGFAGTVEYEAMGRLKRLMLDNIDVTVESDFSKPFLTLPKKEIDMAGAWLKKERAFPELPLVAICPGAKKPSCLWPLENFIEVCSYIQKHRRYEMVVVGGTAEREKADAIVKNNPVILNAAGQFSVLGSAGILKHCLFVIGLDTGTTHLASAAGIPCVGIYGGHSHPGRWYPIGSKSVIVKNRASCMGCNADICLIEGHPCMNGISVDEVIKAIARLEAQLFGG